MAYTSTAIGQYGKSAEMQPNNTINSDVQKRRFALLLHAGYGERSSGSPSAAAEL